MNAKRAAVAVSGLALGVLTLLPPLLYAAGRIPQSALEFWMLLGTVLWFASAPWWMGKGDA
ncbi:MAG TPA: hypothetical protein VMN36_16505 [Verrucomicrobiales bacterium]|nr:hypothetical protein [Verrucomicrobiales bacterium]